MSGQALKRGCEVDPQGVIGLDGETILQDIFIHWLMSKHGSCELVTFPPDDGEKPGGEGGGSLETADLSRNDKKCLLDSVVDIACMAMLSGIPASVSLADSQKSLDSSWLSSLSRKDQVNTLLSACHDSMAFIELPVG